MQPGYHFLIFGMVHLISSRNTFSTFVWRYSENSGERVVKDLIMDHVYEIPAVEEIEAVVDPASQRDPRMERLDPNEWKMQDHYMVLGLQDKRYVCTLDDLRNAYRARVLVYHPDKIAQRNGNGKGKNQKDDAIFKCIQKAYQILTDADRKEAFDHVDPTFDNSIPDEKTVSEANFYKVYGPVFERNQRFSKKPTNLVLGDPETPRDRVEAFYQFWLDFDSIRRFDYLDEEASEGLDNRADKRYMEKKNKAARAKRKTDDNTRIRKLSEQAYKLDPRIKAYKEADKQAKLDKKNQRTSAVKAPQAAAQQKAKEDEEEKKKAEAVKAAAEVAAREAKKAKEAEANALRKERKALKSLFADNNYFLSPNLDAASKLKLLEEEALLVEQICSKLARLDIQSVREQVEKIVVDGSDASAVTNIMRERLGMVQIAREAVMLKKEKQAEPTPAVVAEPLAEERPWSIQETDLLINGTKKFPGGTRNRWETIVEWFNRQVEQPRTVDELLKRANEMKSTTTTGGLATTPLDSDPQWDQHAAKRDPRIDQNEPTLATGVVTDVMLPWSADEQSFLTAAMKKAPADDPERWDKIAALVPTRTKKECMLRAKELATLLKQKGKN